MRRHLTLICAGLVAAATASVIAVGSGGAQAPGERTLTFVEKWMPSADVFADVPPLSKKAISKGDSYLFTNLVLDANGTTRLGVHQARCTYLRATKQIVGSRYICDGAWVLSDGMITGETVFTFTPTPSIAFAVTGGTGAYAGARGSGTLTYRAGADNPFADTVIHLLP